ncbi:alpha/beta fold hydrolase [Cupriavidus lacunae]|uniref:alpha/beta fold hydrolase n=1 Tax=Cupriavidus lacunae TaxID=2666307 RepID=UPI001FC90999|nr:alpha/beta fold hydrolase [Cupriavidus lacunae]
MEGCDVVEVGWGPVRVVAVHGIQGTRSTWLPLADSMADTCTFVLPNLPGRGHAPRPRCPEDYTLDAFAALLRQTIADHAADGPFVLAGWSMGVSVVLAYLAMARQTPSLPNPVGLVLVSGTPQLNAVQWFESFAPDPLLEEIAAREHRLGLREAADHRSVAWTWRALRETDQRAGLCAIDCPTLIIHGSEDEDCPVSHAAAMAEKIPDAVLVVLDGAGHSVLTQNTGEVAATLRAHWPHLTRRISLTEQHAPLETS